MSVPAFQPRPVPPPTLFQRLFRRPRIASGEAAVVNVLAAAPDLTQVTPEQIAAAAAEHGVTPLQLASRLAELYRHYLLHCLRDRNLNEGEVAALQHLRNVFGLSDVQVRAIHDSVAVEVFGAAARDAVRDGRLTSEERAFLDRLQSQLLLPDDIASRLLTQAAQAHVQGFLNAAVADRRLSDEEDAELRAIIASFGAPALVMDQATQATLARYRMLWALENAPLPALTVRIKLQRGEVCHAFRAVDWHELRTVTTSIRYSGTSARIRIMKGVSFRIGEVRPQRTTAEQMVYIDSGTVYVTNKRLIFDGTRKNTTIPLRKIMYLTPYRDGVEIEKETGRNPFLKFEADVEAFAIVLARLVSEAG